jgi:hypothetical protein
LLSLAGRTALGRVLVVQNFFHLRMMEATVFLGTFSAAEMFWYPRSVPRHNLLGALRTIPSTPWFGFCSSMHCQLWDLKQTRGRPINRNGWLIRANFKFS